MFRDQMPKILLQHNLPKADIRIAAKKVPLFDHLVGGDQQFIRDAEAERLDAAEVDHQVELG